jgi:glycosyltransferase involved in cell wall biosynthesis
VTGDQPAATSDSATTVADLADQAGFEISTLAQSVSIIITTYNHARFLAEAIESALRQTVGPGEVIVVDDGSTDDPGSLVSRYPQVQLVRQANQGLAAARNTGWRAARGRYVVFLDADDLLLPEALAFNLRRFAERPECAFVYGSFHFIDSAGEQLDLDICTTMVGEDAYVCFLEGNCIGMHATVMYRRDCLEEVGGFDPQMRATEDYEMYLRLTRRYPVLGGMECIAAYRRHDANMSSDIPLMLDTALAAMRRQLPYLNGNPGWQRALETGIRRWKTYYADLQLTRVRNIARTSGLRQVPLRDLMDVFARAPAIFLKITGRRTVKALRSRLAIVRNKSVRFGDLRRLRPISGNCDGRDKERIHDRNRA